MITVRSKQPDKTIDLFEKAGLTPDAFIFDIETTGLSPYDAQLYLIGVLYVKPDGDAESIQWFAESFSEEQAVLCAFFDFAKDYEAAVSYNGDGFDLRFLEECAKEYHLPFLLKEKRSIDLFKTVKKLKPVTGLTSCRQKNAEEYLGIRREDRYTGGELIEIYECFIRTKDPADLNVLLLHNRNDVEGLSMLLPLIGVFRFFESPILKNVRQTEASDGRILLSADLPFSFPRPVFKTLPSGNELSIKENRLSLFIETFRGTLKLFFPDWRNYVYLPNEGMAIYKCLADFVDPSRKIPASKETAYTPLNAVFVPESETIVGVLSYRKDYADKIRYVRLSDLSPEDYLLSELSKVLSK